MALRNRLTLKGYFTAGAIPKEEHFTDLIDSCLNQEDDNVRQNGSDPLSISTTGAEEFLLDFYRKGEKAPSWRIQQKPKDKPGLSFSEAAAGPSRLFLQQGTGNLGIGTLEPSAKLHIDTSSGQSTRCGLYVTGQFDDIKGGLEVRNNDGTRGLGLSLDTLYAVNAKADQNIYLQPSGKGKVGIKGPLEVNVGPLTIIEQIPVVDSKTNEKKITSLILSSNQLVFTDETANHLHLKIKLGTWFGFGVDKGTLFCESTTQHAWRSSKDHKDWMHLDAVADGGLTVMGTGVSSFAGYLSSKPVCFSARAGGNTVSTATTPKVRMATIALNIPENCWDGMKFKAPVRGLYLFSMNALRNDEGGKDFLNWNLVVNDNTAGTLAWSPPIHIFDNTWQKASASCTVPVMLEEGGLVWVQQVGNGSTDENSGLSGVLITAFPTKK